MQTRRRQFISLGMLMLCGSRVPTRAAQDSESAGLFLSAASDRDGSHWLMGFTVKASSAIQQFKVALPGRGHHVAVHPSGDLFVAVARRPGTWLVLGDTRTGQVLAQLEVPAGRHLYGHGVFSADGDLFYTTESDYQDMDGDSGLLVVWQLQRAHGLPQLVRVAEFASGGVGPHELVLMPGDKTIAIANGGLRTHPDSDREVLNVDTMLPSLVYLDTENGVLLEQCFLPSEMHQASIRHLDVNAEGKVAMGMQFQGEAWQQVPLVATHIRGESLQLLTAPEQVQSQMQQYVGSVRYSADGSYIMASCPRGNLMTLWNAASGELMDSFRSRDGCGVAAVRDGFLFTAGSGRLTYYSLQQAAVMELDAETGLNMLWDNHLLLVA